MACLFTTTELYRNTVVLVANTNGRLAIPAIAGLLVIGGPGPLISLYLHIANFQKLNYLSPSTDFLSCSYFDFTF